MAGSGVIHDSILDERIPVATTRLVEPATAVPAVGGAMLPREDAVVTAIRDVGELRREVLPARHPRIAEAVAAGEL